MLLDGFPYDDGHEGRYAEADASKALEELRGDGVACLCLTVGAATGAEHSALGYEFTLYLLRNPEARERVAAKRMEVAEELGRFIVEGLERFGGTLLIPPLTFAHVLIHTSDSVVLGSKLDDHDLYRPILEMYMSVIKLP